ncbi:glycosyltransferase family 2 protein [Halioglobus maricola]|uniref:Glycosyltransferase family 2 protein n=1 Tax=Halioglobus maricola TaxID=2601894 RepID=A0A5P9NGB9_9GAMM|nr:glycosyltransferase family 2 protein [Halioglobus maricola]QFU74857.1 glycosyltransferase family 2 protein [Halioglobus maricola]
MNLTVSIVTYNNALEMLQRTLASLREAAEQGLEAGAVSNVAVSLVDNGSDTAYRRRLEQLVADQSTQATYQLDFVPLAQNRGFGAGHNAALARSRGDYHLVLNPDVEIAADALAVGLIRLQNAPELALLSPRCTGGSGEQEFLCKRYPSLMVLALRAFAPGLGRRLFPARMEAYEMSDTCGDVNEVEVPLASGCFMLTRGAQLAEVGDFDEGYFLYFEDFDLSLRLSRLGKVLYLPQMRIVHHGGYAASKGLAHLRMFASAGLRFFRQHGWRWT